MKKLQIITLTLLIFLASCIPSLHPIYTEETLDFDANLLGTWLEDNPEETWTFEKYPKEANDRLKRVYDKSYKLTYIEKGVPAEFAVHLIKLKNEYYLDFYPENFEMRNSFLGMHLIPGHIFAKVNITKDQVTILMYDSDWLDELLKEKKTNISSETTASGRILTASTNALQEFIVEYADEENAFTEPLTLTRN